MPRKERSFQSQRSIVAAAKNYTSGRSERKQADTRKHPGKEWQHAAWEFFDTISEYHQGCMAVGALLSRATLIVEERGDDGIWRPVTAGPARDALDELYGGEDGQVEMLRQYGIHFSVTGEGWLIGSTDSDADDWQVATPVAISKAAGGGWKVNDEIIGGNPLVIRIWKPHPRNRKEADSPTRAILPVLSELLQLTKRTAAQIDSRLTGAGLLLLPSETSFASTPTRDLNPGDPQATANDSVQAGDAQGLADLLMETMQVAVQNPESAAAMVPIIGEAPGEYIDKIQHINFWSDLDEIAGSLRDESIRRIATGMDMPPEVLLGTAGSNHWNAWLSDENSVKIHAEPLLKILTSSLTTGYLRPALEGVVDKPRHFRISADTSQMRLRPNRSKEALELHDRMVLSREAVLRENGFTESDLMGDEEIAETLTLKVARGSTTPELVEAALREAGADMKVQITDSRPPTEERPTPSLRDHPVRELPPSAEAASLDRAVLFAAEQMVDRALQRAGNRIKTRFGMRGKAPVAASRLYLTVELSASDVDDVLQDAFDSCSTFDYGVDPDRLRRALEIYTRSLFKARREPSRESLGTALKMLLDDPAA